MLYTHQNNEGILYRNLSGLISIYKHNNYIYLICVFFRKYEAVQRKLHDKPKRNKKDSSPAAKLLVQSQRQLP